MGISWAVFSILGPKTPSEIGIEKLSELASARSKIKAEVPKTEVCPINGDKFTKIERDIWEARRPIAAMIENHLDARPQSGLSRADVIYEAVAEGGITRFLAIFYCNAAKEDVTIGPLRSARVYFIDWASEYEMPLYVHFGGANNIDTKSSNGQKAPGTVTREVRALEKLIDMGWRHTTGNAMDGGANVSYPTIWRNQERLGHTSAWEHSALGSTDLLYKLGIERNFGYKNEEGVAWTENFVSWKFGEDKPSASPEASDISFGFWGDKGDYDVNWKYDSNTNSYSRFNGGQAHTDFELDKAQLKAKNIVIQFVKERGPVDKELHMFYETTKGGDAMIFQNGGTIEGTWKKASQYERTVFYDDAGAEISFVPGVIWIEAVPTGNEISY
jgi:hypothetical protein